MHNTQLIRQSRFDQWFYSHLVYGILRTFNLSHQYYHILLCYFHICEFCYISVFLSWFKTASKI